MNGCKIVGMTATKGLLALKQLESLAAVQTVCIREDLGLTMKKPCELAIDFPKDLQKFNLGLVFD